MYLKWQNIILHTFLLKGHLKALMAVEEAGDEIKNVQPICKQF